MTMIMVRQSIWLIQCVKQHWDSSFAMCRSPLHSKGFAETLSSEVFWFGKVSFPWKCDPHCSTDSTFPLTVSCSEPGLGSPGVSASLRPTRWLVVSMHVRWLNLKNKNNYGLLTMRVWRKSTGWKFPDCLHFLQRKSVLLISISMNSKISFLFGPQDQLSGIRYTQWKIPCKHSTELPDRTDIRALAEKGAANGVRVCVSLHLPVEVEVTAVREDTTGKVVFPSQVGTFLKDQGKGRMLGKSGCSGNVRSD